MEPVTANSSRMHKKQEAKHCGKVSTSTNGVGEVAFTRRMQGQMDEQTGAMLNARRHFITGE